MATRAARSGVALAFLALALEPAVATAGQYGPGPEGFPAVGRFVFRNEAEAIARKVAATRNLTEPVHVVEIHVEQTTMTKGGRGWSVVVVGKIEGGCHAVTVGIAADDGAVYAVGDRRAVPEKAPKDCERWYILGAEGASATLDTVPAPVETPYPKKDVPEGGRTLTKDDAARITSDGATKKGYTEQVVLMAEFRPGVEGKPGIWRVDMLGETEKGCGVYKVELTEPAPDAPSKDWKMRFQNNLINGKRVDADECRRWYEKTGKVDDPKDWIPGKVAWDVIDSDNLQ